MVGCGTPGGVGSKDDTGVLARPGVVGVDDWEEREGGLAEKPGGGIVRSGDTWERSFGEGS